MVEPLVLVNTTSQALTSNAVVVVGSVGAEVQIPASYTVTW